MQKGLRRVLIRYVRRPRYNRQEHHRQRLFRTSRRNIPDAHGTAAETHCIGHRTQKAREDENKLYFALCFPYAIIPFSLFLSFLKQAALQDHPHYTLQLFRYTHESTNENGHIRFRINNCIKKRSIEYQPVFIHWNGSTYIFFM